MKNSYYSRLGKRSARIRRRRMGTYAFEQHMRLIALRPRKRVTVAK